MASIHAMDSTRINALVIKSARLLNGRRAARKNRFTLMFRNSIAAIRLVAVRNSALVTTERAAVAALPSERVPQ